MNIDLFSYQYHNTGSLVLVSISSERSMWSGYPKVLSRMMTWGRLWIPSSASTEPSTNSTFPHVSLWKYFQVHKTTSKETKTSREEMYSSSKASESESALCECFLCTTTRFSSTQDNASEVKEESEDEDDTNSEPSEEEEYSIRYTQVDGVSLPVHSKWV